MPESIEQIAGPLIEQAMNGVLAERQVGITIYGDTMAFAQEFLQGHPDRVNRVSLRINAAIVRIIEEESSSKR